MIYVINCVWHLRLLRQTRLSQTRLLRTFIHTIITLPRLLRNGRLLHWHGYYVGYGYYIEPTKEYGCIILYYSLLFCIILISGTQSLTVQVFASGHWDHTFCREAGLELHTHWLWLPPQVAAVMLFTNADVCWQRPRYQTVCRCMLPNGCKQACTAMRDNLCQIHNNPQIIQGKRRKGQAFC